MINCVVIEDDFVWKTKMLAMLDTLDVAVQGVAADVSSGIALLQKVKPDIVIADVMLDKERVFDIYKCNPAFCKLPTIFVTQSDTDIDYINAKKVLNHLYIVKPVHKLTLKSAIDNLCKTKLPKPVNDGLAIKGKFNQKIVVPFDKIIYINQVQHYCTIYTQKQHFTIKKSLVNVMKDLDDRFMQVHRSYCINKNFIENFGVGLENTKVKGVEIPIGLTFKDTIKEVIGKEFSVK
jgi:two-component system, LytTR family, response regulator LytT